MLETELYKKFGDNLKVKICNISQLQDRKYRLLFQVKTKEELEELEKDDKLGSIVKEIIKFNQDEKEYERMEMVENMWTLEDEKKFQIMEAHREGGIKGEKIGERRGEKIGILKTASNLLSKETPVEFIMEVTNLSKNEIQNLKEVKN